jgi:hypothetical protein
MMKHLITSIIAGLFVGSLYAQTAPTQPSAPTITTQSTTNFLAGVTASLSSPTTNIIYLEQTGISPTIAINQDGNSNRIGSNASGTVNSMILDGATQTVTINQTGNGNLIDTLKLYGDNAGVYIRQTGNLNTISATCGVTTRCEGSNNLAIDWRLDANSAGGNSLTYTGNGNNLINAVYVTGGGNNITMTQTSTAGQQALITLGTTGGSASDNNTINLTQTSASLSSLVLTQTGTGGTTFNISQTGTTSNVANISAVAAGGSFNITQRSR